MRLSGGCRCRQIADQRVFPEILGLGVEDAFVLIGEPGRGPAARVADADHAQFVGAHPRLAVLHFRGISPESDLGGPAAVNGQ